MTSILIAIAILLTYTVTLCIVNHGIPPSLSASVYALPPAGAWLWTLIILSVVALVLPTMLDKTPDTWQFLAFLSCAGLVFVGVCPLVKDTFSMSYKVHCGGAIVCAVASQLLVVVQDWRWLLGWIPFIAAFCLISIRGRWRTQTFWAEMTCFAITFAYYLSV